MTSVNQKPEFVKILTSDDKIIKVPIYLAVRSPKLATMIKILKAHPERFEDGVLRVTDISSENFRRIISWCQIHQFDPADNKRQPNRKDEIMGCWDAEFVNHPREILFKLMNGADSLGIYHLQRLLSKAIADLIKGKSKEEICEIYGMVADPEPGHLTGPSTAEL